MSRNVITFRYSRVGATESNATFRKIMEFYRNNPHSFLRERPEPQMLMAFEHKKILYSEDDGENIVGVGCVFEYDSQGFHESGAARVILNGYGLQKVLLRIRALNEFVFDPPEFAYFSVVRKDNIISQRSLNAAGFKLWAPTSELLEAREKILGPSNSLINYYRLEEVAMPSIARELITYVRNPVLRHKSESTELYLDFQIPLITHYFDIVKELAKSA